MFMLPEQVIISIMLPELVIISENTECHLFLLFLSFGFNRKKVKIIPDTNEKNN